MEIERPLLLIAIILGGIVLINIGMIMNALGAKGFKNYWGMLSNTYQDAAKKRRDEAAEFDELGRLVAEYKQEHEEEARLNEDS